MKILHLHTELNKVCGITKIISSLIVNIGSVHDNEVFTLGGNGIDLFEERGIKIHISNANKYTGLKKNSVLLKELLKINNYDIVHCHDRYFDFMVSAIIKTRKNNIVTSVHSKVFGKKIISYKAPYLIAPNICIKNHLVEYYKINEDRINVIGNFVPNNVSAASQKNNIHESFDILFAGRFCREKGVDILLKSFLIVQKKYRNARLTLLGSGEMEREIRLFIQENRINAIVAPPLNDISKYYNAADLFVLPSRTDPFPLVMLEAGSYALPFIGTEVDGIAEFIENGKDGITVQAENVQELSDALIKIIGDPITAQQMGIRLKDKIEKLASAEIIIPKYLALYETIIHDNKTRGNI